MFYQFNIPKVKSTLAEIYLRNYYKIIAYLDTFLKFPAVYFQEEDNTKKCSPQAKKIGF